MNKVININFQGSIIPIEESASEMLRSYINSLRIYFAQEEGRDEILSDIESRIAELFLERLKKGASCITDQDLREITAGIGHPEDLGAAEHEAQAGPQAGEGHEVKEPYTAEEPRKQLHRSANNQVIGGVAAGLAHYLHIDASIMRVLFILCMMAGFGFLVYIVLWAVLQEKPLPETARKRLFRNPEEKRLGGVASGLAAYFNVDVWIPRVIFLMPFILGGISSIAHNSWFDGDVLPGFIFNGFGGTLFIIYFVLWWVLPEASTAAEKLQMRGEKVDLESIKNTVNSEMQQFRARAKGWGKDMGGRAQEQAKRMRQDMSQAAGQVSAQTNQVVHRSGSGLGRAIGILAKIFVFSLLGIIVLSLLVGLASLVTAILTGNNVRDFILEGEIENTLLWTTIVLFIAVPVIGMLMWLIRVLRGVRSRNKYVGYIFGMLWLCGWVSLCALVYHVGRHFVSKAKVETAMALVTPGGNKLYLKVNTPDDEYLIPDWRSKDVWPRLNHKEDSVYAGNIRIRVIPAKDSLFHLRTIRVANGRMYEEAERHASVIQYQAAQYDSILYINKYFSFHKKEKFRNQQIILVLEVPYGKKVEFDRRVDDFDWYDVSVNTGNGFNLNIRNSGDEGDEDWEAAKEYVMSAHGLLSVTRDTVKVQAVSPADSLKK